MFIFLIPYCLGGIAGPALQAVISIQVPETEQGKIQGTLTSLMSASAIVGPPLMTGIFYYFTKEQTLFEFAGAPFLLASILMTISALMAYYSFRKDSLSAKR
jgi:DHA1 family tetracycline resistance protein-like MFS transporter